jgi:uncharacterized membrane protein SirB2
MLHRVRFPYHAGTISSDEAGVDYLVLRQIHAAFAVATLLMFFGRGALLMAGHPLPRILRWLPHLNDTLLLAAAITLAIWSGQYPFQQSWLTAKVVALVCYILLGKQALRPGLTWQKRLPWFCAALLAIVYIFAVALTRSPLPL